MILKYVSNTAIDSRVQVFELKAYTRRRRLAARVSQPTNEPVSQPASAQKWIHIFLLTRKLYISLNLSSSTFRVTNIFAIYCRSVSIQK